MLVAELGLLCDALDARKRRGDLRLVGLDGNLVVDAGVGCMNREGAYITKQAVDFTQRAFRRLDDVSGILAVGDRLVQTIDLSTKTFRNDQTGRIVGGSVDAKATRKFLNAA